MAEPTIIPLTPHQRALLASYGWQERTCAASRNAAVTAIIAATTDPALYQKATIDVSNLDVGIVITPAE